jgi:phosphohistidine phosphatase
MRLVLVHHGDAVGPEVDPSRPLSAPGRAAVERLAALAAARGVRPDVVWHSGKLRARQTAEAFWRACNALAEFSATKDLQPDDPAEWMRDRLHGETRDVLLAGHFTHMPRLLNLLLGPDTPATPFPLHGVVALVSHDEGKAWKEMWRAEAGAPGPGLDKES